MTVNRLTDAELKELDDLRAAACGKVLVDREAVDFSRRAFQQMGRLLVEIRQHREQERQHAGS